MAASVRACQDAEHRDSAMQMDAAVEGTAIEEENQVTEQTAVAFSATTGAVIETKDVKVMKGTKTREKRTS